MIILGKKLGMTQFFSDDGAAVPVTLLEAGPAAVTALKSPEKDGYEAVQLGFGPAKKIKKPQKGQLKDLEPVRHIKEFRIPAGEMKRGDKITVENFKIGDVVKVSAVTKGKGFQGAVKRHGFHGMPASHGHKHVTRHVGSIGQRFPQHTLKGMRGPGRMGGDRQTTRGLKIISIDAEHNILAVKGAVPGRRGALVEVVKM